MLLEPGTLFFADSYGDSYEIGFFGVGGHYCASILQEVNAGISRYDYNSPD